MAESFFLWVEMKVIAAFIIYYLEIIRFYKIVEIGFCILKVDFQELPLNNHYMFFMKLYID